MTAKITLSGFSLCLLIAVTAVSATINNEYIFEFGVKNGGTQIYDKQGTIHLLSYNNEITIPVPRRTRVSYVRVVVDAVSAPKVDFDAETRTVSIQYSWTQVPLSTYKVFAKGVPDF